MEVISRLSSISNFADSTRERLLSPTALIIKRLLHELDYLNLEGLV
jgi:hypothetical protein